MLAAQRGVVVKVGFMEQVTATTSLCATNGAMALSMSPGMGIFRVDVRAGDFVALGAPLGISGSTGNSTGIHLHLTLQHLGHGLSGYVV